MDGDEFVGEEAGVVEVGDGLGHGAPLEFLSIVEFVAAGNASSVEMANVLDVFSDRADDVAFHDLHVIDVVQQLHPG